MTVVLDAGALLAIERGDRQMAVILERERRADRDVLTHGGVVGQVWRGGSRQATVARALATIEVRSIDEDLGRKVGVLLGLAHMADVIDAAVVLLAQDGDEVYTSDAGDLEALAVAAGRHIELIPV